jgi:hypothetical protein
LFADENAFAVMSRRDSDIAMAIYASYVIGQFMPLSY